MAIGNRFIQKLRIGMRLMSPATGPNIQRFIDCLPQIAANAYVHTTATVIGDVVIGEDSSVWPSAVIRGDVNFIRIGSNSNV